MIPAVLSILAKLPWKWLGLGLAVAIAVFAINGHGYSRGRRSRDAEVAVLAKSVDTLKFASAQAAAGNAAHVLAVEHADAQIQKEKTDALSRQLADARDNLADYVRLHAHVEADPGHAGATGLPQAAGAAGAAAKAGAQALVPVPDLEACAQAYVTATGWQEWWAEIEAVPR